MWCGEQTAAKDDGKSLREIHDTMQQLQPITEQQARDAFCRTIRSAHKKELTGVVKAQATTTKRSAITVEQQYRWHVFVDAAWAELKALNKEETGTNLVESLHPAFETLMHHFILIPKGKPLRTQCLTIQSSQMMACEFPNWGNAGCEFILRAPCMCAQPGISHLIEAAPALF